MDLLYIPVSPAFIRAYVNTTFRSLKGKSEENSVVVSFEHTVAAALHAFIVWRTQSHTRLVDLRDGLLQPSFRCDALTALELREDPDKGRVQP